MAGGKNGMGRFIECLEHYPGYGKAPDKPEEHPAQCATEYAKGQRRVGADNKDEDRGMLDDLKTTFGFAYWPRTVER